MSKFDERWGGPRAGLFAGLHDVPGGEERGWLVLALQMWILPGLVDIVGNHGPMEELGVDVVSATTDVDSVAIS